MVTTERSSASQISVCSAAAALIKRRQTMADQWWQVVVSSSSSAISWPSNLTPRIASAVADYPVALFVMSHFTMEAAAAAADDEAVKKREIARGSE